jgi:L-ascorbate metabolism protein UlaG (beta-lactamase superfamily)
VFDSTRDHKIEGEDEKSVYYFCSHSHPDHYDPHILNKQYVILSNDIDGGAGENIVYMKPNEFLRVRGIYVTTFGSTDLGVSFFVEAEGHTFFHSGDLNLWHWENDTPEVQEKEKKDYHREIKKLRDRLDRTKLDVAFVPVDTRLGDAQTMAIDYFLDTINVKHVFPMHFRQDYSYIENLKKIREYHTGMKIYDIKEIGEEFEL